MKISEAIGLYVQLRDKLSEEKSAYQDKVAPLVEKKDKLEAKILEALNSQGVESFKTEFGTAYTSSRTTASIADKDSFLAYMKEHNEWSLTTLAPSAPAIKQFIEATEGDMPPGVNLNTQRTIVVKRA